MYIILYHIDKNNNVLYCTLHMYILVSTSIYVSKLSIKSIKSGHFNFISWKAHDDLFLNLIVFLRFDDNAWHTVIIHRNAVKVQNNCLV